jgi:hypothetical protein
MRLKFLGHVLLERSMPGQRLKSPRQLESDVGEEASAVIWMTMAAKLEAKRESDVKQNQPDKEPSV